MKSIEGKDARVKFLQSYENKTKNSEEKPICRIVSPMRKSQDINPSTLNAVVSVRKNIRELKRS